MIFVDTGAWIAILNPNDQYHREAVAVYGHFQQQKTRFLTTDYVIDETVTRLRYDTNHSIAVMFLERIELLVETGILTLKDGKIHLQCPKTVKSNYLLKLYQTGPTKVYSSHKFDTYLQVVVYFSYQGRKSSVIFPIHVFVRRDRIYGRGTLQHL